MLSWIDARSLPELVGASFAFFSALTVVSLLASYGVQTRLIQRGKKVFDVRPRPGQVQRELLGNLLWHLLWCPSFALALHQGWLRFAPWTSARESLARELGTAVVCMVAFQAYYWCLHRAMHWRPLFFMHRWHHRSLVVSPLSGFSMHPLEGVGWALGWIGPAALLSQLTPLGAYGFAFFLCFDWCGNIGGHMNAEINMPGSTTTWGSRLVGNPVSYHCLHHARFNGHYGFATAWMDALAGTQFDDWVTVAEQVSAGKPLTEIYERRLETGT